MASGKVILPYTSSDVLPDECLVIWGDGGYGPAFRRVQVITEDVQDIAQISINQNSGGLLLIKTDGTLWQLGYNYNYTLGTSNGSAVIPTLTQVGTDTDWAYVSTAYTHSLAIKTDGTLWFAGLANTYQRGDNSNQTASSFTQIGTDTDWTKVEVGYSVSAAIKGGKLVTCGQNGNYKTGQNTNSGNTTTWTSYDGSTGWTDVFLGYYGGFALKSGELYGFGTDISYVFGNGAIANLVIPTQIGTDTDWKSMQGVYSGIGSLGIKQDGTLWGTGTASYGNLGNGGLVTVQSWAQISSDTDHEVVSRTALSASPMTYFNLIIKGGKVYAAGTNGNGGFNQDYFDPNNYYDTFQDVFPNKSNAKWVEKTQVGYYALFKN